MSKTKRLAIVPTIATDAMEQAAFEAAGSPSDWFGFQEMWVAALAKAPASDIDQLIASLRRYVEASSGDEVARSTALDAITSIEQTIAGIDAAVAGVGNNSWA